MSTEPAENYSITAGPGHTPDPKIAPLDPLAKTRRMAVFINVAEDFEKRFDNQWMIEREIMSDRYTWQWADSSDDSCEQGYETLRDTMRVNALGEEIRVGFDYSYLADPVFVRSLVKAKSSCEVWALCSHYLEDGGISKETVIVSLNALSRIK